MLSVSCREAVSDCFAGYCHRIVSQLMFFDFYVQKTNTSGGQPNLFLSSGSPSNLNAWGNGVLVKRNLTSVNGIGTTPCFRPVRGNLP